MSTPFKLALVSGLAWCLVGCSQPAPSPPEASLLDMVAPVSTPPAPSSAPGQLPPGPERPPQLTAAQADATPPVPAAQESQQTTGPLTLLPGHHLANRKLVPTIAQTNRGRFGVAVTPGAAPEHCRAVVQAMLDGAFVNRPLKLQPGFVELTGRGHFLEGCRGVNRFAATPGAVFARGPATLMIITGPIESTHLQGAVCIGFLAFGREVLDQLPTSGLTVVELKPLAI